MYGHSPRWGSCHLIGAVTTPGPFSGTSHALLQYNPAPLSIHIPKIRIEIKQMWWAITGGKKVNEQRWGIYGKTSRDHQQE